MLKKPLMIFELPYKAIKFLLMDILMLFVKASLYILFWPIKLVRNIFSSSHTGGWKIPYIFLILSSVMVWFSKTTGILWEYMNPVSSPGFITSLNNDLENALTNVGTLTQTLTTGTFKSDSQGLSFIIGLSLIEILYIIAIVCYGILNSTLIFWATIGVFLVFSVRYILFLSSITTPIEYFSVSIKECITMAFIAPISEIIYYTIHSICCLIYIFLPGINILLYMMLRKLKKTQYIIPLWSLEYTY